MKNDTNYYNEENYNTIERCPHDEENPYSQISNELIRDESISPNCRWLIIYLLSNKGNWKINVNQIKNHVKSHIGKNKLYSIIKEAIEAGYMIREDYINNNLRRCKYFVSEKPKFKKFFLRTDCLHPQKPHDKETISKEENIVKDNVLEKPKIVHNLKKEKPIIKKTLPRFTNKNKTMDAKRRWKLTDHQYDNLQWLKDQGVDSDEKTLCYWVKSYSFERLNEVLQAAKKVKEIRSLGAYVNKLLIDKCVIEKSHIRANETFARDYAELHKWNSLKIFKKYCYFDWNNTKIEIPFSLTQEQFINFLISKHELSLNLR